MNKGNALAHSMKTPELSLECISSSECHLRVHFVHSTASSVCWLHPRAALLLVTQRLREFWTLYSLIHPPERGLSPLETQQRTEGASSQKPSQTFPQISLSWVWPTSEPTTMAKVMGALTNVSIAGPPAPRKLYTHPLRERGRSQRGVLPSSKMWCCDRRKGKWLLGKQPVMFPISAPIQPKVEQCRYR